jgi:nuclear receptor subfamily 2 group E protein 1
LIVAEFDHPPKLKDTLCRTALEGEGKTLVDVAGVASLQDHTQMTLSKYVGTAYPEQPFRFGKVLLLLPALRAVSPNTIEELFFRRTIGPIPIERIICDMYKSNRDF